MGVLRSVFFFQSRNERPFQLFPGMMTESASFRQCDEEEKDQADNTQETPHSCRYFGFNNCTKIFQENL